MKNRLTFILIVLLLISIQISYSQSKTPSQSRFLALTSKFIHPMFGENVFIFDSGMYVKEIQNLIDTLYNQQHPRKSEFGL